MSLRVNGVMATPLERYTAQDVEPLDYVFYTDQAMDSAAAIDVSVETHSDMPTSLHSVRLDEAAAFSPASTRGIWDQGIGDTAFDGLNAVPAADGAVPGSGALRFSVTTVPRHTAQDLSTTQRTRLLQFAALLVRRMRVMAEAPFTASGSAYAANTCLSEGTMSINGQAVSLDLSQGERPTSARLERAWAVACTPYVANSTAWLGLDTRAPSMQGLVSADYTHTYTEAPPGSYGGEWDLDRTARVSSTGFQVSASGIGMARWAGSMQVHHVASGDIRHGHHQSVVDPIDGLTLTDPGSTLEGVVRGGRLVGVAYGSSSSSAFEALRVDALKFDHNGVSYIVEGSRFENRSLQQIHLSLHRVSDGAEVARLVMPDGLTPQLWIDDSLTPWTAP